MYIFFLYDYFVAHYQIELGRASISAATRQVGRNIWKSLLKRQNRPRGRSTSGINPRAATGPSPLIFLLFDLQVRLVSALKERLGSLCCRRTYKTRSATCPYTMSFTNSEGGDGACMSQDAGSSPVTPEWIDTKESSRYKPVFSCNYCGAVYGGKNHLSRHVTNNCLKNPYAQCNTDKKNRPYVCLDCGCRYKMQKALRFHQKHECSSYATCPMCHKTMIGPFVSPKHLKLCKRKMDIRHGTTLRTSPELISKVKLNEPETIDIVSTDSD